MKNLYLRFLPVVLIISMLSSLMCIQAEGIEESNGADFAYLYLTANEMQRGVIGTWSVTAGGAGSIGSILRGATNRRPQETVSCEFSIEIDVQGVYYTWARSRDFLTSPGTRHFAVDLNHQGTGGSFGTHGTNGWDWDMSQGVALPKGRVDVTLIDTSANYARVDYIVITNDPDYVPPNELGQIEAAYAKFAAATGSPVGRVAPPRPTLLPKPEGQISVIVNETELMFAVAPIMRSGIVLVPMRRIFEELGAEVTWEDETKTVSAARGSDYISFTVGSKSAYINGVLYFLDHEAVITEGCVMVPIRFISEALKAQVGWDDEIKLVEIIPSKSPDFILLRPDSFPDTGSWVVDPNFAGAFENKTLRGSSSGVDVDTLSPAQAKIAVEENASYRVWVHARDYEQNQPGSRFFNVSVGETELEPTFGRHGVEGFVWEDGGVVELEKGEATVKLIDSSGFFARCDAILLSKDLNFTPGNAFESVRNLADPVENIRSDLFFPAYARTTSVEKAKYTIRNHHTAVTFFETDTPEGTVIQKETEIVYNGSMVKANLRSDGFGYILLWAQSSKNGSLISGSPIFVQEFNDRRVSTTTIYDAGVGVWMIPDTINQLDEKTVEVSKTNEYGTLTALWRLDDDDREPLVTVGFTAAKKGAYSIGMFNYPEISEDTVEYMLAPFKVHSKRIPDSATLISEQFAFSPYSGATLGSDEFGQITFAVVVDPLSIPENHWAKINTSRFGMNVLGPNKGVMPGVFAPLFGNEECHFDIGDKYEFHYRPIIKQGDWFTAYRHAVENVYKLTSYRKNYYTSLTDAIFNTRKLMLDDVYGGWDIYSKGHYNMEHKYRTSQANPLQALQVYLLSDCEETLERRAIPTLVNLLTRGAISFNRNTADPAANVPIGSPIRGFNTSTFSGAYYMTRGLTPVLQDIANEVPVRFANVYGAIPDFVEWVAKYKMNGDPEYLRVAKAKADEYIHSRLTLPQTTPRAFSNFIYLSYYPHFASLIDIYEVTKEQRYLEAAVETARMLVSTIWLSGMTYIDPEDEMTIKAEDVKAKSFNDGTTGHWNYGDIQWRLGSPPGVLGKSQSVDLLEDETVPKWLVQRVGIGLEQASTFHHSFCIFMQNFSGDLMRLSKYAEDPLFEVYARNAIIGRFSNYQGYYINDFYAHVLKPDYPYTGPDYTSIYWHHIPAFLSMLEDFLISQAWTWSDGNINFPSIRQQGFAYFDNRQYGFAPGRFFDQDNVWLWLREDIMKADNVQIDWLAARKDGTLCLALMNEDTKDIETEVSLLEAADENYTGKAILYNNNGQKSEIDVENGRFSVTIPGNKLVGVVIKIESVRAPEYSKVDINMVKDSGGAVVSHEYGKGMILQVDKTKYFAYTYVTDTEAEKVVLNYKIGKGQWQTEETAVYPYEFITRVDGGGDFNFVLEIHDKGGGIRKTSPQTLKPVG